MSETPARALAEQLAAQAEAMRLKRYDIHGGGCDDTDYPVPCGSDVCAREYVVEKLLREAAAALLAARAEGQAPPSTPGAECSHSGPTSCRECLGDQRERDDAWPTTEE